MTNAAHQEGPPTDRDRAAWKVYEGEGQQGPFFNPPIWDLGTILPEVIQTELEQTGDTWWPSVQFELSPQGIVGTDLLPTNRQSRLRTIVNAIEREAPDSLWRPGDSTPVESYTATRDYLKNTNKVQGQDVPRHDILNLDVALGTIEIFLAHQNDPVTQALDQVREQFGEQLGAKLLSEIRVDTLLSAKQTLIIRIYKEVIDRYKNAIKTSEKLSWVLLNGSWS